MIRPEIQRRLTKEKIDNNEPLLSDAILKMLDKIEEDSSCIELGGLGIAIELVSTNGVEDVTLCDESALSFAYRAHFFPKSKVAESQINPLRLTFSKPVFDYVIINDLEFLPVAQKLAKKGIINNVTEEFTEVKPKPKVVAEPKTPKSEDGTVDNSGGQKSK